MDINFKDLFKDQAILMVIIILLAAALIGGIIYYTGTTASKTGDINNKKQQITDLTNRKAELEVQLAQLVEEENNPEMKKIFTVEGMKFGPEASFAPLFDDMITIAKATGIRIRSVDYNYSPSDDPIAGAKIPGVNTCELTTTIVGTYTDIQRFLKTILSESYLVNISQIEIVSWKRDKSILIANLKLGYYTKTK